MLVSFGKYCLKTGGIVFWIWSFSSCDQELKLVAYSIQVFYGMQHGLSKVKNLLNNLNILKAGLTCEELIKFYLVL